MDLLLYPSQNDVPPGLFRPVIAGQSFRLPELVLLLALGSRLAVRGGPKRISPVGVAWVAFCTWYLLTGVFGLFAGHALEDVLFQAKAVIYLGGGVALLAGVDPGRLVTRQAIGRWFLAVGLIAAVMFPLTMRELHFGFSAPGLSLYKMGEIGPDASSALVILGTGGLLIEGCRRRGRALIALAALPMVLSVFSATQRAAMLGLAAALVGVTPGLTLSVAAQDATPVGMATPSPRECRVPPRSLEP